MVIYIVLVAAILLLNYIRSIGNLSKRQFCWIIGVAMILITGLRGVDVGADTVVYYFNFERLGNMTWSQLTASDPRDFGYYSIAWLVSRYIGSFTVITMIAALAFYVPITLLIQRYSEDPGLSFLVLMAFNFFQFSMTGIRQTMAIGMTVLFMMELLKPKVRLWRCVLWLVIAVNMHASAWLILVFPLVRKIWSKREIVYATLCLIPIVFVFRSSALSWIMEMLSNFGFGIEEYEGGGGGLTTFIVYFILLLWGLFFSKTGGFGQEDKMPYLWLGVFEIAVLLQPLVMESSVLFRVVWYFAIYMIIYIPKVIKTSTFGVQVKQLANIVVYAGVLYMYLFMTIDSAYVAPYMFWFGEL